MIKLYLGCPYSHPDPLIRHLRFQIANQAAGTLMEKGYFVFSPISHSHCIGKSINRACDRPFWLDQDISFLKSWADEFGIICIRGWRTSDGICDERSIAEQSNKTVIHFPNWDFLGIRDLVVKHDRLLNGFLES